jgi:hypothetical protein
VWLADSVADHSLPELIAADPERLAALDLAASE